MTRIQQPLTLAKHPELLSKITEMKIGIKLHWMDVPKTSEVIKAQENHPIPSWNDVFDLLTSCFSAINEQREDPRKY